MSMSFKLFISLVLLVTLGSPVNALFEELINEDSVEDKPVFPQASSCPCRQKVNTDLVKALRRCSLIIDEDLEGCKNKKAVSEEISHVQLQSKSCLCNSDVTVIIESAVKCCNDALQKVIRFCSKVSAKEEEEGETDLEALTRDGATSLSEGDEDTTTEANEESLVPEGDEKTMQQEEYTNEEENADPEEYATNEEENTDSEEYTMNEEENTGGDRKMEEREAEEEDIKSEADSDNVVNLEGYSGTLTSCTKIKSKYPRAGSGYYYISPNKKKVKMYCEMSSMCGVGGGWTRLGYLDVKKSGCPGGFVTYKAGGVEACGRPIKSHSICRKSRTYNYACASLKLPSNGVLYSQVCGKVIGYQYGGPYGFYSSIYYKNNAYSSRAYVDGISITEGSSRKHIWTLVGSYSERYASPYGCKCPNGYGRSKFVGHHYFCEAGTPSYKGVKLYYKDPLWDGKQCRGTDKSCCKKRPHVKMPWFRRLLPYHTKGYLEMRVCGSLRLIGDTPFSHYEFYVK